MRLSLISLGSVYDYRTLAGSPGHPTMCKDKDIGCIGSLMFMIFHDSSSVLRAALCLRTTVLGGSGMPWHVITTDWTSMALMIPDTNALVAHV